MLTMTGIPGRKWAPAAAAAIAIALCAPHAAQGAEAAGAASGIALTGTVKGNTSLTITGPLAVGLGTSSITVTPSAPDESVAAFFNDITTALGNANPAMKIGAGGVTVTNPAANQLVISGPTATFSINPASAVNQDVALTTTNYNFATSNGALATVDPSTNLTIQIAAGAAVAAPAFNAGETVAQYAAALQAAVGPAATSGVTVSGAGGVLSITGPANMTIGGSVTQDFSGRQANFAFGSYTDPATGIIAQAAVDPSTSLTVTSLTTGGVPATITVAPSNPAGETVAQYVIDLNNALTANNISGVTATSANGVLSLTGPSAMTVGGYINQDILGTTVSSSVTPTSPVTTTATAALPAAALTPGSTSTTTLGEAAPVAAATSGILAADAVTIPSVSNSTLVANTAVPGTIAYTFAPTGTVSGNTVLTLTDGVNSCTVTPSAPDESLTAFANDINAQLALAIPGAITATATGTNGVLASNTNGTLSIAGAGISITPTVAGVQQDVAETATNYNLVTSNGAVARVAPRQAFRRQISRSSWGPGLLSRRRHSRQACRLPPTQTRCKPRWERRPSPG